METTEFPVAPTEQPRAGVILFHEPSKEGDDDESCSDHTDADTDALLMTASSQRDLMEELQRVQASEEVYHDAGTRGSRRSFALHFAKSAQITESIHQRNNATRHCLVFK